jgi:biotin carboxyl carrier protein
MRYTIESGKKAESTTVNVRPLGPGRYWVQIGDAPAKVVQAHVDAYGVHLLDDQRSRQVLLGRTQRHAWSEGFGTPLEVLSPHAARVRAMRGAATMGTGDRVICSPMPGRIIKVLVAPGDAVEPGQGLVIVEAMKMENELRAEMAGVVASVHCTAGETVEGGAKLIELEPLADPAQD